MEAEHAANDSGADAAVLDCLFGHLSGQAELFARYQHRDDPDMTPADRLLLLRTQLDEDPADFLCRYHRHVPPEMADSLERLLLRRRRQIDIEAGDAEMDADDHAEADSCRATAYLTAIRRAGRPAQRKNRRYQALQRLVAEGEFFSDESMRNREPYLYHRYIGRYQLATDTQAAEAPVMSHFLMRHCDRIDENDRYTVAAAEAVGVSDSSDEDEEVSAGGGRAVPYLPEAERRLLRAEFTSLMHRRFLSGGDAAHFDYAAVDNDEGADVSTQHLQDEEDGYFDSEEPS